MHSGAIVRSALGSALSAAYGVMAPVVRFAVQSMQASLGVGKLKARENPRLIGTDKEHLTPSCRGWYKTKALEFSRHQISVEVLARIAATLQRWACFHV